MYCYGIIWNCGIILCRNMGSIFGTVYFSVSRSMVTVLSLSLPNRVGGYSTIYFQYIHIWVGTITDMNLFLEL